MAAIKHDQRWRARLTRDIGWSMLVKLVLLTLLWALFFSGEYRCRVDGAATASRLALEAHASASHAQAIVPGGDRCD